jgi:hypothetical protein
VPRGELSSRVPSPADARSGPHLRHRGRERRVGPDRPMMRRDSPRRCGHLRLWGQDYGPFWRPDRRTLACLVRNRPNRSFRLSGPPWGLMLLRPPGFSAFRRLTGRRYPTTGPSALRVSQPRSPTSSLHDTQTNEEGRSTMTGATLFKNVRRRPTLPRGPPRSTIGAEELNFRVRNGTGCFPFAITAETLLRCHRPRGA